MAERLYTCILLVFTRYKPSTHKLETLRKLTNALDKRLITVFPFVAPEGVRRFKLLCEAYIEARYNKNYVINHEELRELAKSVGDLMTLTERLCNEKINDFLLQGVVKNKKMGE